MRAHEVERGEIADAFIKLGRASEIREQEGQAGDFEPLMYVHRVGAVEIAKDLVGEQAFGRQEGLAPAQELLKLAPRDPQFRQHPGFGVVFERQAQWPRTQLYGFRRRAHLVEDERKALAFVRRLAFDVEELGGVRHRIEDDHKIRRQLQRKLRLPAGRKLDRIKRDLLDQSIEVIWKIDRRAPEYLAKILRERKLVLLAGRGFGKTRSLSEFVIDHVACGVARRIALVAATSVDARGVLVEGPSGILACSPDWNRPLYEPSKRRLTWRCGAIATTFSADEPERLRGPQHDLAVADELGSWRRPEAWDNLMFGLRLGTRPRCAVATTPRPTKLIRELLAREGADVVVTRGTSYENRGNLAPGFFANHKRI